MSDYIIKDITEETQIAFNFQGSTEIEESLPVPHEFGDTLAFPNLSEWSRHSINNTAHGFEGISFKNNNLKPYVTVTMTESQAGFKNIFGKYVVDENGTMHSAGILASNTRNISEGDRVSFQHGSTDDDLQFFLVANGYSYNKHIENSKGAIDFVYGHGTDQERLAKITDDPATIDLIYKTEDQEVKLTGPTYHTSNPQLNHDGKLHSIAGLSDEGNENSLRVGFEDFPNLGDADFDDLVFDVEIFYTPTDSMLAHGLNNMNTASGSEHDVLVDIGNDLFEGGMYRNSIPGLSDDDSKINIDGGFTNESLETLLALENILERADTTDLAITEFVENTGLADASIVTNNNQPVAGTSLADTPLVDNIAIYGDFS